jgi:predicted ATPase
MPSGWTLLLGMLCSTLNSDMFDRGLALRICQHLRNMLIFISTRPIEVNLAPTDFLLIKKLPNVNTIRMGMLSRSEVVALVCAQLAVDTLPKQVEELFKGKSQGNPFYIAEMCNSLLESKQILVQNGKVATQFTSLHTVTLRSVFCRQRYLTFRRSLKQCR